MLMSKQKKGRSGNRVLITVTVLGSAGPLRFVVNEDEIVGSVIDMALKSYSREGRLPLLGSDSNGFLLHCPLVGSDALSPWDAIGAHGARNFMLCKKPQPLKPTEDDPRAAAVITRKGSVSWKTWINKTLNLKIASH